MGAAGHTIAILTATALVLSGVWMLCHKLAKLEFIDRAWGDWPNLPIELMGGVAATRKITGGEGEAASSSGHGEDRTLHAGSPTA